MDESYVNVKLFLYSKNTLHDAIRWCFTKRMNYIKDGFSIRVMMPSIIDESIVSGSIIDECTGEKLTSENFIVTQRQLDQLRFYPRQMSLCCSPIQIMLYAYNCISRSMLQKILNRESLVEEL